MIARAVNFHEVPKQKPNTNNRMLYLVALIQKPTKKEEENGATETLVLPPTPVLARDDKAAAIKAVADSKDKITADLSNVEVLVRPF